MQLCDMSRVYHPARARDVGTQARCGKSHNRHLLLEGYSLQLCPVQLAMHALHVCGEVLERLVSLFSARV